jgi:mRNA interferase YafQ
MKKVYPSGQFKKDFKRYVHQEQKVVKLKALVMLLENDQEIPDEYRAHKLTGQYRGCLECHIESDFLLIWIDENESTICLMRLGSHSELFRWVWISNLDEDIGHKVGSCDFFEEF